MPEWIMKRRVRRNQNELLDRIMQQNDEDIVGKKGLEREGFMQFLSRSEVKA